MRKYLILFSFAILCACGPRGGKAAADASARREFPAVEVPSMYTDRQERAAFAAGHFWDRFTDTTGARCLRGRPLLGPLHGHHERVRL